MSFFCNSKDQIVQDSIDGVLRLHSNLCRLDGYPSIKVVLDRHRYELMEQNAPQDVAVLSGGGSGHEPAFASMVGTGLLSAAVCGEVFASPSESSILTALRHTTSSSGALVIVNNYTGDKLNFGAAIEKIKVETGFDARMVIVADDVALRNASSTGSKVGARGLAGCMLIMKCAGAVAAQGKSLDEVERMATRVAESVTTMGCAVTGCTLPGQKTKRIMNEGELEMGLGAHGEPGACRQTMRCADDVVLEMVERVGCTGKYEDDQRVRPGDRVVVLLNNLGSITQLEMGIIISSTIKAVTHTLGAKIERFYPGMLLSSLDMKGFSISLLRIDHGAEGDEVLKALDAPTEAPGWPRMVQTPILERNYIVPLTASAARDETIERKEYMDMVYRVIVSACDSVIACADKLNELDAAIGDGDCGDTYRLGCTQVKLSETVKNAPTLSKALLEISNIAGEDMGGSSGALLKIFFLALSGALHDTVSLQDISTGVQRGCEKISYYGGAVLGDSTMLDALIPLSNALQQEASVSSSSPRSLRSLATLALEAAQRGAETTRHLIAKAGRASYVPGDSQKDVTDPGCEAVVAIMRGIHKELHR